MQSSIISGTVVHIRKISKKLAFFDIENTECERPSDSTNKIIIEESLDSNLAAERVSVVFKSWECGDNLVRAISSKEKIHVGDIVHFCGYFENKETFSVNSYEIKQFWSSISPGEDFIPRPPADAEVNNRKRNHSNLESDQICKHFLNTGKCLKTSCKFLHPDDRKVLTEKRVQYVKNKKEKQLLVHESNFQGDIANSSQRARVYADWIVGKFGLDFLKTGKILDIGGGRGDLSFELGAKLGLDCIVVDPRPQKMKRWQVKFIKKNPSCRKARHIQDIFDSCFFDRNLIDIKTVNLIVGLHPDEATEPLVDTAVDLLINFCVIPCCVFSQDFPNRKLKNGNIPTSYENFCEFLAEKCPGTEKELLPFIGKNKVIFKRYL